MTHNSCAICPLVNIKQKYCTLWVLMRHALFDVVSQAERTIITSQFHIVASDIENVAIGLFSFQTYFVNNETTKNKHYFLTNDTQAY